MDIRISGHQVDTGAAFAAHVRERLASMAEKYFPRSLTAHVTLGAAPHGQFSCDVVMHVMADIILKGSAQANGAHPAFDAAAERIDKQLRRYMRRLKDRQSPAAARELPPLAERPSLDNAEYKIFAAVPDDVEPEGGAPLIIAETRVDIPTASVGDAVMMLDLRNTTALMFVNSVTGHHNMVYRREDGTIGWVEPREAALSPRRAVAAR